MSDQAYDFTAYPATDLPTGGYYKTGIGEGIFVGAAHRVTWDLNAGRTAALFSNYLIDRETGAVTRVEQVEVAIPSAQSFDVTGFFAVSDTEFVFTYSLSPLGALHAIGGTFNADNTLTTTASTEIAHVDYMQNGTDVYLAGDYAIAIVPTRVASGQPYITYWLYWLIEGTTLTYQGRQVVMSDPGFLWTGAFEVLGWSAGRVVGVHRDAAFNWHVKTWTPNGDALASVYLGNAQSSTETQIDLVNYWQLSETELGIGATATEYDVAGNPWPPARTVLLTYRVTIAADGTITVEEPYRFREYESTDNYWNYVAPFGPGQLVGMPSYLAVPGDWDSTVIEAWLIDIEGRADVQQFEIPSGWATDAPYVLRGFHVDELGAMAWLELSDYPNLGDYLLLGTPRIPEVTGELTGTRRRFWQ